MGHFATVLSGRVSAMLPSWLIDAEHPRLRRMIHQTPLLFMATFAIAGVLLGSILPTRPIYVFWLPGAVIAVLAWEVWTGGSRWTWLMVAAMCLPLFAVRQAAVVKHYQSATILSHANSIGEPAIVRVTVDRPIVLRRNPLAEMPGRRNVSPWQTEFEARANQLRVGHDFRPCSGRVLVVSDGRLKDIRPGDQIDVYGSMRSFAAPTNPGERDLRDVYRRRNLHARIDVDSPDQLVVRDQSSYSAGRIVAWFADKSREQLLQHTSEQTGPLAIALVIGQRDYVDRETRDRLLVTGTAHLLSVSGLHLAIIVMLAKLISMMLRWPPTCEIIWILGVCAGYVALTGGRPPVLRAAFLIAALMIAIWLRRPSQPINTLAFAALLLAFWNPLNVTAVGVQLSFLAVATLVLCGQRLRIRSSAPAIDQALENEDRLRRLSDGSRPWLVRYGRVGVSTIAAMTWFSACVTATSIPLVWYHFHVVSPISVATNVLLSPLLVVALASGVATVCLGAFSQIAGAAAGAICTGVLWLMDQIIQLAASIPHGHFWLPSPNGVWVAIFYAALAATLFWRFDRRVTWFRRAWILVWGTMAWWMATTPTALPDRNIEATFVDVGHGTSVVLRLDDEVWLYDCGRLGNDTGSSRDIDATLWSLGVTKLDGVFLSHADSDHYNALPGILKRFAVDKIITPPGMMAEDEKGALDQLRTAIAKFDVPVHERHADEMIQLGQHRIDVLHPPIGGVAGDDNANSLVLSISDGALLLPGDLEPPGTQTLINRDRPRPGGALMAPHHGSLTMDAESVLQWARPRETIVSGGKRARRPEVADMLSATGSGVYVTANQGAVRVRINDERKIQIQTWLDSPW